jgi:hypothetical protein
LLFVIGTASIRRDKKHDPNRNLGLSHPAAFRGTSCDANDSMHSVQLKSACIGWRCSFLLHHGITAMCLDQ